MCSGGYRRASRLKPAASEPRFEDRRRTVGWKTTGGFRLRCRDGGPARLSWHGLGPRLCRTLDRWPHLGVDRSKAARDSRIQLCFGRRECQGRASRHVRSALSNRARQIWINRPSGLEEYSPLKGGCGTETGDEVVRKREISSYWLADPHDAFIFGIQHGGCPPRQRTAGGFVGQELDATTAYAVSKQVQIGGGMGHLFPGGFLKKRHRVRDIRFLI
jgi:hypothetical protein